MASGCGQLQADYIQQDRADYTAMQPCIQLGIQAAGEDTLEGRSFDLLNKSRDERITAAEEKVAAQGE